MPIFLIAGHRGSNLYELVKVDDDGHIQADILTSALPTDAALESEQVIQNSWLATIAALTGALSSLATDTLRVLDPRERAPLKVTQRYSAANVGPHAETQRWSYTVPANHKAIVELLYIQAIRLTAATTVGRVEAYIYYLPSGGSSTYPIDLNMIKNAVGDETHELYSGALWMLAGDILRGLTGDTSTGGTILYTVTAVITEFDA